jgi:glycine cleavage system H protein
MPDTYFTSEHEWIRVDGDTGTVGVTNHAQEELGDVVYIELPDVGTRFSKGDDVVVIESVKAASEAYAPVDGEILEVNSALEDTPETVNADAEGEGWMFKIKIDDASQLNDLMDRDAYEASVA